LSSKSFNLLTLQEKAFEELLKSETESSDPLKYKQIDWGLKGPCRAGGSTESRCSLVNLIII
jgi:hypothetical protein